MTEEKEGTDLGPFPDTVIYKQTVCNCSEPLALNSYDRITP